MFCIKEDQLEGAREERRKCSRQKGFQEQDSRLQSNGNYWWKFPYSCPYTPVNLLLAYLSQCSLASVMRAAWQGHMETMKGEHTQKEKGIQRIPDNKR